MELNEYLWVLRRRWRTVVAATLLLVGLALATVLTATPQYTSTARLFVSASRVGVGQAYEGGLFSEQRVLSYADLAEGEQLAGRVVRRLGLDMEPRDLASRISTSVEPQTVILGVSVTAANPRLAQRLADNVARELTVFVSEIETPPGDLTAPVKVTIVDAATLPQSPTSPQPTRVLGVAAVLGVVLGMAAALLRDLLDSSLKSPEQIAATAGAPVIGEIPYDGATAAAPLVTALPRGAARWEAFRILRTNLQYLGVDRVSRVFVVTSPMAREGKTTTATNLAITIAQAGQRVLLVGADLRRPAVDDLLGVVGGVGLTTVLVGKADLDEAVQEYLPVPNLAVLTSGAVPPNPSELLQSRAMADLLERVRREYDLVIVDAPPVLPVADAALLARQADGTLVLVRQGRTRRDHLERTMDRLEVVNGRTVGVVVTMVRDGTDYARHYNEDRAALQGLARVAQLPLGRGGDARSRR